ncbi:MAG: Trp biosynthesis-associated membrane protein, partial [Thermobispora bispora]|nr:Trp biosynthesis-associated membrane protein [Thermobispora bispora]
FDRPDARRTRGGRAGSGGRDLWDAIDRGEDPTAGQP